ncbi:hypothetical protein AVDCRST_MAG92-705 [uncultured Coleofasciculus sp.]|uniref:Uncharacterized protein n=1 Tax=uncultured Coleofasciculus sp. TaxID=1267456 RepID=A0A6J4HIK7_9CYAN|nr:hypothetical protein AVDCRST_MAG92-705 [uncultured Coleofasciculus sp.]
MYRKASSSPTPPENFELPFEGKLSRRKSMGNHGEPDTLG